jgi:hypothetical protein
MPFFDAPDDEEIESMASTGGRQPETLKKRRIIVGLIERYLKEFNCKHKTLAELVTDKVELENCLCQFFHSYRVGKENTLPKKNTLLSCRSHIKCEIMKLTEAKIDIQQKEIFPKFHVSFADLRFTLFFSFFEVNILS